MQGNVPSEAVAARREHSQSERLDNFVDGAFAFAITLLVISGASLPRTVDALVEALCGVPAFAACFAQLAWLWHGHVRWRETVARSDNLSVLLSLLLVFFALIFVFPLHLVYASFFHWISGGVLSPRFVPGTGIQWLHHVKLLFACYGLTYACMAGTLWALHRHAVRSDAGRSAKARMDMRMQALMWAYVALVGLLSMLLALLVPGTLAAALAGFSYVLLSLIGVVMALGYRHYRRHPPG